MALKGVNEMGRRESFLSRSSSSAELCTALCWILERCLSSHTFCVHSGTSSKLLGQEENTVISDQ